MDKGKGRAVEDALDPVRDQQSSVGRQDEERDGALAAMLFDTRPPEGRDSSRGGALQNSSRGHDLASGLPAGTVDGLQENPFIEAGEEGLGDEPGQREASTSAAAQLATRAGQSSGSTQAGQKGKKRRRNSPLQGLVYELVVVQQPMRARMTGFGDKDRRPIDPPVIVKVLVSDFEGNAIPPEQYELIPVSSLACHARLTAPDLVTPTGHVYFPSAITHSVRSAAMAAHAAATALTALPTTSATVPIPTPSLQPAISPVPPPLSSSAPPSTQPHPDTANAEGHGGVGAEYAAGIPPAPARETAPAPLTLPPTATPSSSLSDLQTQLGQASLANPSDSGGTGDSNNHGSSSDSGNNRSHSSLSVGPPTSTTSLSDTPFPVSVPTSTSAGGTTPSSTQSSRPALPENPNARTRNLLGALTASAHVLKNEHEETGIYFCFVELAIRTEGHFALSLELFDSDEADQPEGGEVLAHTFSQPFRVYSAKNFPGMSLSSELVKAFAKQGVKLIRLRGSGSNKGGEEYE